jgi:CHAT domain-containing protein
MGASISRRDLLRLASSTLVLGLIPAAASRAATGASWLPGRASAVEAALGAPVYEEYRGDFAMARRLAEDALVAARRKGGVGAVADALLVLGVVDLLAGEAGVALARFREAEGLAPGDRDRLLWARTGAAAAFLLQLNTFPDGTSAEGDEVDRRRYGTADLDGSRLAEVLGRQHEAAAGASERTRLQCELVKQLFYSPVLARDFASFGFDQRTAGEPSPLAVMAASQALQGLGAAAGALDDDRLAAYVVVVAADAARRLGNLQEAEALLASAEEAYREAGDAVGLAVARLLRGDWWAAPLSTPSVLNLALSASPNADSSLGWSVEDAEIARSGLDPARARVAYAEAERGFRRAGAPRGVAALDLRYGYLATIEGDHRGALAAYGRAAEGFAACGDGLGLWSARIHHALARVGAGERPEDRETARALGTWGAGSGAFGYALGLGMLCSRAGRHWLLGAGDYERALACHRLAEAVHGALGATVNHAQTLVDQGVVFREVGERAAAVALLGRAADLYRGAGLGPDGVVAPAAGRLVSLLTDLYQAHVAARDADGQERVAAEMTALVDGVGQAGAGAGATDPMLSLRLAFQGRAVSAQAAVTVPTLRGMQARDRGDAAEAGRQFDRALASARASDPAAGDPDFLEAIVQRARKDYPAAARAFARYVERLLGGGGREDALITQMRRLDPGRAEGEARKQVARVHEQAIGFYPTVEAHAAARRHLQALEELGGEDWWQGTDQPWQTLADVGLVYEGLGEHGEAARRYRQAVELLEGRRERLRRDELKTAIASGLGPQYLYFHAARNAVDAAATAAAAGRREEERGLLAEGFGYAERGKARGLLDLMAGGIPVGLADERVSASVRAWREASARVSTWRGLLAAERGRSTPEAARIAYLGERIEAEEETLRRIDATLSASDPAFHQAISARGAVLDVRGVAERLPVGTALLQYAFLGNDLLAWAVNRDGLLQAHRAGLDAKALELQIRTLHARCETRAPLGEVVAPLVGALLEPLAVAIDAHPDLVVVPYGAAHALPFHALPWKGEPLVATHTVSYLPSASTLQYVRRGRAGALSERLLAVGNPAAMAYQPPFGAPLEPQPPLPASALEASRVAGLFPQGRALIGPEATVAAVRAAVPEHRLLHFATHGHLSEDAPLLSAILLADGGALTVYDLVGLRLDADLVVLSACRTGQGATTGGDDVLGLTRGLLAAGARAAVVSLWPVDDLATSLLMERFYRDLRAGRAAEAALQSAQNALRGLSREQVREESRRVAESARGVVLARPSSPAAGDDARPYAHPYYWAPFVLVG